MGSLTARLAVVLIIATAVVGCDSQRVASCADWVQFDSVQDRYDEATAVFVASKGEREGTTTIYGVDAHTHSMRVDEVVKGELADEDIRITSMPITCTEGDQYPDGDPLETSDRIIVFANSIDGQWFTLTPDDGTLPYSALTISNFRR
ncbi:hypothetical protein [Arthrobacter sp. NPDC092385]|uniref:hypothetical protein n=1 Tax=Arthrobacter sp. NPDC092385 TaxID=3363943 RepID=UPI0037FA2CB5